MLSYGRSQALLRHMTPSSTSNTARRVYSIAFHQSPKIRKTRGSLVTRPIQRGAKKVSVKFDELPHGTAPLEPLSDIKEAHEPSTAEQEVQPKKRRGRKKVSVEIDELPQGKAPLDSLSDIKDALEASPAEQAAQPKKPRARKKTSMNIDELPQGVIALDPLPAAQDVQEYPTVVQQARNNMRRFDNCVVLTRVGGFYELYFEHADECGPLLNLKVAQKRTNGGPVSMAGFPFFQLDRYLKILVEDHNRYVAIAEEFPNEAYHDAAEKIKSGALMHDRRVSRIVSPGTLIDENFIDPFANNYVLAIHVEDPYFLNVPMPAEDAPPILPPLDTAVGVAWLDLTTGSFFTQSTTVTDLPSLITRIAPREIVIDERLKANGEQGLFSLLGEDRHVITYFPLSHMLPISEWDSMLETGISKEDAAAFTAEEVGAGSNVLQYVQTRLPDMSMKLQPPVRKHSVDVMGIDKNSMRALEIKTTIRDGLSKGSLLHTIRRTVTASGARLLGSWLTAPSTSIEVINERLDLVTRFIKDELLREQIDTLLHQSHDSQRIVQKFLYGRGDADDLLALARTIHVSEQVVLTLQESADSSTDDSERSDSLRSIIARFELEGPNFLAENILNSIDEDGVSERHRIEEGEAGNMMALAKEIATTEGTSDDIAALPKRAKKKVTGLRDAYYDTNLAWVMKPTASHLLQKLHNQLHKLGSEKETLEEDLRKQLGATTLTLRWTPQLGHICHVKGKDLLINPSELHSVSSSKSTRSFHHPLWTALGQKIDQMKLQIRGAEQVLFQDLRSQVILNLVKLRQNALVLDELDVTHSFATLAIEKNYVRPVLTRGLTHKIIGGRHPTVEGGLFEEGRTFTTNDCFVGHPSLLWLITGPNMAGKSTFLRQNALITILAQVGSYVPASFAEIGVVDQIFSRVGSADNLFRDQSTFMVEMLETATILRGATDRSFVIMDEIGRGTAPRDGVAVAFAVLWHLLVVNKCRTLFATHFHELVDLVEDKEKGEWKGESKVGFYCTDVKEWEDGGFSFVHRLREGINRDSHALKVARLAGLPERAVGVAKEVLESRGEGRM